jgi:DNA-binding NarL/FixJ family response regulator
VHVLIADDETIVRLDLRDQLVEQGLEVCGEARTGKEAVELAGELEPDLVILDVKMPELDGIEAARRINAARPTPIVLVTGYTDESLVSEAIDAGVDAYLVKPFGAQQLLPAVRTAVARHEELMRAQAGKAPRRRRSRDERKEELLDVAARLFHERGYDGSSIQDIADAMGMLKGSLYYYFSSKEALLEELVDLAGGEIREAVEPAAAGDALARLRSVGAALLAYAGERPHMAVLALGSAAQRAELAERVVALVEETAVRPGVDPRVVAELLLSAAESATRPDAALEGATEILVTGIAA